MIHGSTGIRGEASRAVGFPQEVEGYIAMQERCADVGSAARQDTMRA